MRTVCLLASLIVMAQAGAFKASANDEVRSTIQKFNDSFNDGFRGPADYATEDWNHINPYGGRTNGRDAALREVREVHQTFLKGAKETIESIDIRFATDDVAIATVVSVGSQPTAPDGTAYPPQRGIRTFVVVKRSGHWLIMQDQNTFIAPTPR